MRKVVAGICRVAWLAGAMVAATPMALAAGTYADVASILAQHCVSCHHAGGSMPSIALDTFAGAKAGGQRSLRAIRSGAMPPWYADPARSVAFRNDPRLSPEELHALAGWVAAGMPQGTQVPEPARAGAQGWSYPGGRAPDAVINMPRIDLAANGELPYIRVLIKVGLPHDRWIEALQPMPGNVAVVHHMGVAEVTLPPGMTPEKVTQLEAVARRSGLPEGAFSKVTPSIADPSDPDAYDMLATFTPGGGFESYPDGAAKLIRAGNDQYISFNIHYTTTGRPESDQSRLALWFADRPPAHQLLRSPAPGKSMLANGRELLTDAAGTRAEGTQFALPPIAAFDANYTLTGVTAVLRPMTLYALQPHAHMRATSFRYAVISSDGQEQLLLSIPHYDFHWQLTYELKEPVLLKPGSKLVVSARYDNSQQNRKLVAEVLQDPAKRCSPDKLVYFRQQNQIWDEMFSPIIEYAVDRNPASGGGTHIVRATGCVVRAAQRRWALSQVGRIEPAGSESTSAAELAELAHWPAGKQQLAIGAAAPFDIEHALGHRVAVKGVQSGDDPISLTSLQVLKGACH